MKLNYLTLKKLFILLMCFSHILMNNVNAQSASITSSNAISFDGIDDFLQPSSMPTLTNKFTMMAWIKPTGLRGNQTLFGWGNTTASTNNSTFLKTYRSFLSTRQNQVEISGTTALTNDEWVHVAFTRNGDTFKIYLNGSLIGNGSETANTNVNRFSIASYVSGVNGSFFKGLMDEYSLWTIELDATTISNYKDSELIGSESGLVLYYKFNQGIANEDNTAITNIIDASSSSNNASINNLTLDGMTSNFVKFNESSLEVSKTKLEKFEIYPNPVNDELTIISQTQLNSSVSLYNLNGQQIMHSNKDVGFEIKMDLSPLKTGVYILEIKNKNGLINKKIFKL